jgi:hypothetical protein
MPDEVGPIDLVGVWRQLIVSPEPRWVLFRHGTCVAFAAPVDNLEEAAVFLLREFGPVRPGTASADFSVVPLDPVVGWVVTCEHESIHTYVHPSELGDDRDEASIGLLGRAKREKDAEELAVVHLEQSPGG